MEKVLVRSAVDSPRAFVAGRDRTPKTLLLVPVGEPGQELRHSCPNASWLGCDSPKWASGKRQAEKIAEFLVPPKKAQRTHQGTVGDGRPCACMPVCTRAAPSRSYRCQPSGGQHHARLDASEPRGERALFEAGLSKVA